LLRSASAFCSSSFNSKTFLSCPARATRKLFVSVGEGVGCASAGVAGKDGAFEEVGVGRADSLLFVEVATGKLRDKRFGLRGVYDIALVCLTTDGRGGGSIAKNSLLGELPT
jgi:hypothetical protein